MLECVNSFFSNFYSGLNFHNFYYNFLVSLKKKIKLFTELNLHFILGSILFKILIDL